MCGGIYAEKFHFFYWHLFVSMILHWEIHTMLIVVVPVTWKHFTNARCKNGKWWDVRRVHTFSNHFNKTNCKISSHSSICVFFSLSLQFSFCAAVKLKVGKPREKERERERLTHTYIHFRTQKQKNKNIERERENFERAIYLTHSRLKGSQTIWLTDYTIFSSCMRPCTDFYSPHTLNLSQNQKRNANRCWFFLLFNRWMSSEMGTVAKKKLCRFDDIIYIYSIRNFLFWIDFWLWPAKMKAKETKKKRKWEAEIIKKKSNKRHKTDNKIYQCWRSWMPIYLLKPLVWNGIKLSTRSRHALGGVC